MKKFIALLLVLMLALGLVACGDGSSSEDVWKELGITEEEKQSILDYMYMLVEEEGIGSGLMPEFLVGEYFETYEEAEYFVQNCGVNWNELYLKARIASGSRLSRQAIMDDYGYTEEEADAAIANLGMDWNQLAVIEAQTILAESNGVSGGVVMGYMQMRSYTEDLYIYAVENCGADWNEQALQAAENEIQYGKDMGWNYTRGELYAYLTDGTRQNFTAEAAEYALSQLGY